MNSSLEEKSWGPRVLKLFQIKSFKDVRLVIDISINIFFVFFNFFSILFTGLAVSGFNQMYEILE